MKNTLIPTAIAAILAAGPALADTSTDSLQQQIDALKAQNERLEATVDYLKSNTQAARKEAATQAVDLAAVKTTANKYVFSGDFRYRHEIIDTAANNDADEHTRQRERMRLRFGVAAKINDTLSAKLQIATTNTGADSARSTNQTLGSSWDKKGLSIDQAYVDWKPINGATLTLGKMPMPWTRTASYFWDGDLTPEGAAFKWSRGAFFANAFYLPLNERDSGSSQASATDSSLAGAQIGIKQPIGKSTLTAAIGYFDTSGVQHFTTQSTTGCTVDGVFGGGQGTSNNANGNTTTTAISAFGNAGVACTRLLSDFNQINALVQYDFLLGSYPVSAFVDYMKNDKAELNPTVGKTLDDAKAIGVTFNKAGAAKTWEIGLVYEENGKDAIFGQYVDSDYGAGKTDAKGFSVKGAYVPATNWTLNATALINKLNYDGVLDTANTHELSYKRYQLDLNYKF